MNRKAITLLAVGVAFGLAGAATADVGANHNGTGGDQMPNVGVIFGEVHNTWVSDGNGDGLPVSGTSFTKNFREITTHDLTYTYEQVWTEEALFLIDSGFPISAVPPYFIYEPADPGIGGRLGGLPVGESIINESGVAWSGFRFGVSDAEVLVLCGLDDGCTTGGFRRVEFLPVDVVVSDIFFFDGFDLGVIEMIVDPGDDDTGPIVTFTFENELPAFQEFNFQFVINTLGSPDNPQTSEGSFTMFQEPITIIPAPGAALLAAIGFGAVGWVRRRMG